MHFRRERKKYSLQKRTVANCVTAWVLSKEHLDVSKIHMDFEQFLCVLCIYSYNAIALQVTKEQRADIISGNLGQKEYSYDVHSAQMLLHGLRFFAVSHSISRLFIQLVHSGSYPAKTVFY